MAEMSSSNQLAVQMPSTLESIKISMNTMVSSMAAAQTAINTGFNTTQAVAMRQAVSNVSVELTRYREGLERINQTPVKAPEPPTWNSVASERQPRHSSFIKISWGFPHKQDECEWYLQEC